MEKNKICCFFGHREVMHNIRPKLTAIIEKLITEENVTEFYVGHQGQFGSMVYSVVKEQYTNTQKTGRIKITKPERVKEIKYSKEFKEEALKLSDEIGLKKVSQQLGIQYYTLSDWRSKRNAENRHQKYQMSDEELKKRNLELEKEIAELRKANEILKDALGFFAKDRKK